MNFIRFILGYYALICTLGAEPNEAIIAHAQAIAQDPCIEAIIQKGEILAQRFSTPEFLEPFIHAEAYKAQRQQAWNNQLVVPITTTYKGIIPPIGMYNADIVRSTILAATWGLEWWLYTHCTEQLTSTYITQWQTQTVSLDVPIKKMFSSPLLKFVMLYSIGIVILQQAYAHYHLAAHVSKPDHMAISELLNGPCTIILDLINPQHWTATINQYLINLGLIDSRANTFLPLVSKEFIVQCAWLYHYLTTVVAERIDTSIAPYADKLPYVLNNVDNITATLHKQLHPSFTTWTSKKIFFTPLGHATCNTLIAAPALYRIGQELYTTFNAINQIIPKETDAQSM